MSHGESSFTSPPHPLFMFSLLFSLLYFLAFLVLFSLLCVRKSQAGRDVIYFPELLLSVFFFFFFFSAPLVVFVFFFLFGIKKPSSPAWNQLSSNCSFPLVSLFSLRHIPHCCLLFRLVLTVTLVSLPLRLPPFEKPSFNPTQANPNPPPFSPFVRYEEEAPRRPQKQKQKERRKERRGKWPAPASTRRAYTPSPPAAGPAASTPRPPTAPGPRRRTPTSAWPPSGPGPPPPVPRPRAPATTTPQTEESYRRRT